MEYSTPALCQVNLLGDHMKWGGSNATSDAVKGRCLKCVLPIPMLDLGRVLGQRSQGNGTHPS